MNLQTNSNLITSCDFPRKYNKETFFFNLLVNLERFILSFLPAQCLKIKIKICIVANAHGDKYLKTSWESKSNVTKLFLQYQTSQWNYISIIDFHNQQIP